MAHGVPCRCRTMLQCCIGPPTRLLSTPSCCAAGVHLYLTLVDWHVVDSLSGAGARLTGLSLALPPKPPLWPNWPQPVPAELAALTQLRQLSLADISLHGGWQHLPRQLRQLDLSNCSLERVPAELTALAHLSSLCLNRNEGFSRMRVEVLPQQLRHLELSRNRLRQVPPALTHLTQLTDLRLDDNPIQIWSSLQGLSQLQRLHLQRCRMQQVPADLADLTQLTSLSLAGNPIEGGWQHLPRQLRQLDLEWCGLQHAPAELAGLVQLRQLSLDRNPIAGSGQHLPGQLQMRVPRGRGLHLPTLLSRMLGPAVWVPTLDFARWAAGWARVCMAINIAVTVAYLSVMFTGFCLLWSFVAVINWLSERLLGVQLLTYHA